MSKESSYRNLSASAPSNPGPDQSSTAAGDGLLRSNYDGFAIGRQHGSYFYPGSAVLAMAIRDESPLVVPYPAGYFATEETGAGSE